MAIGTKRKLEAQESVMPDAKRAANKKQTTTTYLANSAVKRDITSIAVSETTDMQPQLDRIARCNKTPFQKRVLSLLCQVPRGQVTTYGLISKHLGSSPRAVGNAMRRNPFAPQVPCHRVVATGGALGGFKGEWPKNGEGITLDEKRLLLRQEGIEFDGIGRVVGTPFCAFV